jgi:hypothetical protein
MNDVGFEMNPSPGGLDGSIQAGYSPPHSKKPDSIPDNERRAGGPGKGLVGWDAGPSEKIRIRSGSHATPQKGLVHAKCRLFTLS